MDKSIFERDRLKKSLFFVLILTFTFVFAPVSFSQEQHKSNGNISFQPNSIPDVNVYYDDYSFVFEYKSFFIRIRPFVIYDGTFYGMKRIVQWIKNNYPNVDYKWLLNKIEKKFWSASLEADIISKESIHFGFNLTKLNPTVSDKIDYVGFKLVDLNFPLSAFELETVERGREEGQPYNITLIKIPKANLVFSFEDLYPYGYSIEHINKTHILIGNVTSREDLIIDPIVYSGDDVTITGYSEGNECNFTEVHEADLDGTLELLANTSVSPPSETLRPNTNGTYQEWETLKDSTHWQATNDSSDSTYIATTGSSSKRDVQHIYDPVSSTVASIEVFIRAYSDGGGGAEKLYMMDKVGGDERLTDLGTITRDSWNQYSTGTLNTNPAGGSWTTQNITDLEVGVQVQTLGSGETLNCSEIWVLMTASAFETSLDKQIRPADSGALRLTLIITGYDTSGTITLNGRDSVNDTLSEDVSISADGNYVSNGSFRTIDTDGVLGTGVYGLAINQSRWGIISKLFDYGFGVDANIYLDWGAWFAEEGKQIIFGSIVTTPFWVWDEAHLRLGRSVDETLKLADRGCHIITTKSYCQLYGAIDSYVEIYASTLTAIEGSRLAARMDSINLKMWMSNLDRADLMLIPSGSYTHDIYRLGITGTLYAFTPRTTVARATFDDFFIHSNTYAFSTIFSITTQVTNVVARNNTYLLVGTAWEGTFYFINTESDSWTFYTLGTGEAYRQYTFDLTISYMNYTLMENANVTITNSYLGTSDSWLTFSNGSIPTQTYSYGHYNQTGLNNLYDYNPYNITVTKDGLQTYTALFNVTEKTDLTIALQESVVAEGFNSTYYLLGAVTFLPFLLFGLVLWRRKRKNGRGV